MALAGSACCSSLTATPRIGLTRRDAVPKHTPLSAHACARACACVAPAEPLRARREPLTACGDATQVLEYLRTNNVYCLISPSHASIWAQDNDAGDNASFSRAGFAR